MVDMWDAFGRVDERAARWKNKQRHETVKSF